MSLFSWSVTGVETRFGICVPKDNTYEARQVFKSLNFNEYVLLINGAFHNAAKNGICFSLREIGNDYQERI